MTGAASAVPDRPTTPTITLSRLVLAVMGIVLTLGIVRLAGHAWIAFSFPYGVDYGEGVVWQQMRDIVAGQGYRPIGVYPAIAYEYPPFFHLCAAAVARLAGIDELYAGRLVSLASAVACAVLVAALTARSIASEDRRVVRAASAIAGLVFLSLPVVGTWALMMRVDLLAYALTLGGMVLASHAPRSLAATLGAGLLFTLALYTRQTCLPAPIAAFAVLLLARPSRAWMMAATSLASGLAALALLQGATQGGFLLNIVFYNINRIIWDHAQALALVLLANLVIIAIGMIGLRAALERGAPRGWAKLRSDRLAAPGQVALAIIILTLAVKTLMLPAILKSGASDNYLIDWFAEIAMLAGIAVVPVVRAAIGAPAKPSLLLLILLGIGVPIQGVDLARSPDVAAARAQARALDTIVERIRASRLPVISDDATLLLRAGKPMQFEPAIVAELGSAKLYDEPALITLIRARHFGFFVTDGDAGDTLFDQRFNPAVAAAIHQVYPRQERIAGRILHLPPR